MKLGQVAHPAVPQDPVVSYLESKTVDVYSHIVRSRDRGGAAKGFQIGPIKAALLAAQTEATRRREAELEKLRSKKQESIVAREEFRASLGELRAKLGGLHRKACELAQATGQLSVTFSQITDRLASASQAVTRAREIIRTLEYIKTFNERSSVDAAERDLRSRHWPSNLAEKAAVVANLLKIVGITETRAGIENARRLLAEFRASLSEQLLQRTRFTSKESSYSDLRKSVTALVALENGAAAIQAFIHSTPIWSDQGQKLHFSEPVLALSSEDMLRSYDVLCGFIQNQAAEIWPTIDAVFDPTQQVKLKFLQTVFQTVLGLFVNQVLDRVQTVSRDSFCPLLDLLFVRTSRMLTDIAKLPSTQFSASALLDNLFRTQFSAYSILEIELLRATLHAKINPLIVAITPQKGKFMRKDAQAGPFEAFDPSIGPFLLAQVDDAWKRCFHLSFQKDLATNLKSIFGILFKESLRPFFMTFIQSATDYVEQNANVARVVELLRMVSMMHSTILSLEDKYLKSLKPLIVQAQTYGLGDFLKEKTSFIEDLEAKVIASFHKVIAAVGQISKKMLTDNERVAKAEFMAERGMCGSSTCSAFCALLRDLVTQTEPLIGGHNRTVFFTFLGIRLYETLTDFLTTLKFRSPDGSCILVMDINDYDEAFGLFHVPALQERMEDFRRIGQLMTTSPGGIADTQASWTFAVASSAALAKKFLRQRSDAKEIRERVDND